MRTHTQLRKFLERVLITTTVLITLSTLTALAQVKGTGQTSAKLGSANARLFLPAVTYDTGGWFASGVAVADLNGDGNLDVIVTNISGSGDCTRLCGGVGVLLGNGDGTFQQAVSYSSGGDYPESPVIADVNGDGKPDLVVVNLLASSSCPNGSVDILLGNGDGTFQAAIGYCSGGSAPTSVAVADVNSDGNADLVVSNAGSSNLGVLIGNGDGTFRPAVSYGSGAGPSQVVVADVNGDLKPDLVTSNFTVPSIVSVLLGNGDGTFQPAVIYAAGGYYAASIAVADVNGDGFPDLLVANERACTSCKNGSLGVLLGNRDGTFQPAVGYRSGGDGATGLILLDANGDGKLDAVLANYESDDLGVLVGNGDGTFQSALTYDSGGSGPYSVAVGDMNGDGRPDLLAANWYGNGNDRGLLGVLLNSTRLCTTPPVITLSTTPTSLWPPNGRMVRVTVSGTITETAACAVNPKTIAYAVTDEYGQVQPSGRITLGAGGTYSFTVSLQASRLGKDLDGRQYTITVRAKDNAGNAGSASTVVTVPHDQRH